MAEGLRKDKLIYRSPSGTTYIYRGRFYHWPAVIKDVTHPSKESFDLSHSETVAQSVLHHQNICKLYYHIQDPASLTHTLVLEPMEGSLEEEIEERKQAGNHWEENWLWWYLACMVDALAYAQEQGVAHSDVSPENLFFNADKYMKISDFGNAEISATISTVSHRTPKILYFASPELKSQLQKQSSVSTSYNPYQSDVYSLGLVFLNMIMLRRDNELMFLEGLEGVTARVLGELQVSDNMKKVLGEMLKVEDRRDFLQLRTLVNDTRKEMESKPPLRSDIESDDHNGRGSTDHEEPQVRLTQDDMARKLLEKQILQDLLSKLNISMTCDACKHDFQIDPLNVTDSIVIKYCCKKCATGITENHLIRGDTANAARAHIPLISISERPFTSLSKSDREEHKQINPHDIWYSPQNRFSKKIQLPKLNTDTSKKPDIRRAGGMEKTSSRLDMRK